MYVSITEGLSFTELPPLDPRIIKFIHQVGLLFVTLQKQPVQHQAMNTDARYYRPRIYNIAHACSRVHTRTRTSTHARTRMRMH